MNRVVGEESGTQPGRQRSGAPVVDPAEAVQRVAGLSDAEVQRIAGHLDQLPAGQGAIGAVIGAAVLIFLILLVTDLLGLTDVYPFVRN